MSARNGNWDEIECRLKFKFEVMVILMFEMSVNCDSFVNSF